MINARMLAYQILLHLDQKASHPDRLIRATLERHSRMEDRDRALLTELVYGVLRWQGRLDWHIDLLSKIKPSKISPAVRALLRLALYQILLLDRIPPHAAVNETVKIAKATQPAFLANFVNAILREALRRGEEWEWPSAEKNPAEHLAVTTSHPLWFVKRCLQEFGFEETRALCMADNGIAPLVFRINGLKTTASQALERFREEGLDAEPSPYLADAVRAASVGRDVSGLSLYREGWVQVQDEASQLISHLVGAKPGERVLDLCSGFGGKSTHLATLMNNEGEITAVDNSAWKLQELKENAARQGIGIISVVDGDALDASPEKLGLFDRVLVDAPCSGFGAMRRKPDIKWRRHPKDPFRFSRIQKDILVHASKFVKKGGVLVYATCTLFAEENEEVAVHFSEAQPTWIAEPAGDYLPSSCESMTRGLFFRSWPHLHGTDGFFGARWRNAT